MKQLLHYHCVLFAIFMLPANCLEADETPVQPAEALSVSAALSQKIIDPNLPLREVQTYTESRVIPTPAFNNSTDWDAYARDVRNDVLDKVVFRGEAAKWRKIPTTVEWLDTIDGGPGYRIRKLRYEILPGMWVVALLYEPDELKGKVPVVMNVNGHDRPLGKAAEYKQIRCINQAKRGMIALNVEWLGMGQLTSAGFNHYCMNQLNLCGTSGLAPFYLTMSRGTGCPAATRTCRSGTRGRDRPVRRRLANDFYQLTGYQGDPVQPGCRLFQFSDSQPLSQRPR